MNLVIICAEKLNNWNVWFLENLAIKTIKFSKKLISLEIKWEKCNEIIAWGSFYFISIFISSQTYRLTSRLNAQVSFEEISAWLLNCQVLLKYHLAIPLDHESTQLSRLVNITRIKFSNMWDIFLALPQIYVKFHKEFYALIIPFRKSLDMCQHIWCYIYFNKTIMSW